MCVICIEHEKHKLTDKEALSNAIEVFTTNQNDEHLQELVKTLIELVKE